MQVSMAPRRRWRRLPQVLITHPQMRCPRLPLRRRRPPLPTELAAAELAAAELAAAELAAELAAVMEPAVRVRVPAVRVAAARGPARR